jgi:hypothetical protein
MSVKTIQDVASQLCYLIKDHDVCLIVAKYYVKERIHQGTEKAREYHMSNLDFHGHYFRTDHKLFSGQLIYLTSKTTIRGPYWRASAAAWQIPNLNKKILTLKDKLNDLNYIPKTILTGVVMKYWFHDRENDGENNYITV